LNDFLIFGIGFMFLSAGTTLIKSVFAIVFRNFEPSRDTSPGLIEIQEYSQKPWFPEFISLGRVSFNVASGLCLYEYFRNGPHSYLFDWLQLPLIPIAIGIVVFLYTFTIFLPNLFANLRPYSIVPVVVIQMRLMLLVFTIPARFSKFAFLRILEILGYDKRFQFLNDKQMRAFDSDGDPVENSGLEADEKKMIMNIFDLGETYVREIMTPRIDMVSLNIESTLDEVNEFFANSRHSRIPVWKENPDTIVGILYNRDFLEWHTSGAEEEIFNLKDLIKPAFFVPLNKKVDDLMRELRLSRYKIAVVVDEYGGTSGIVTLEDILEEIVGEIRDEDEEVLIRQMKDGSFMINPVISLSDLMDEIQINLNIREDLGVETLGGLIQATLESIPLAGTEVIIDKYKFRILKVEGQRMSKVLMTRAPIVLNS
jgi:CBS domain containing-hemolysin-like protein